MANLVCDGPGPHTPPSGILGTTTGTAPSGMRCGSAACRVASDPREGIAEGLRAGIRGDLASLRAYRDAASPTAGQTTAVVKVLCRVAIRLARVVLSDLDGNGD